MSLAASLFPLFSIVMSQPIHIMESIVASKGRLHFFEYLEVDLLQEYLRTGIGYFVNALLHAHPRLVPLRYWAPELSALLDFIKDLISLSTLKATYAENFFGYERPRMRKWSALKGAIVWAVLPYLSSRLEQYYTQLAGEQLDGARLSLPKKILKETYPYLYLIFGLMQTFYRFLYLYRPDDERYYHLLFRAERLHLERAPMEEGQKYPLVELLKKPGLLMVLVGHKVLTWYFSRKQEKREGGQAGSKRHVSAPATEEEVRDNGKCSICTKKMRTATMVRVTGYVYCLDCISQYVRTQRRCPLGGAEASPEDLQILYG